MKVLKKGRKQKGWAKEFECSGDGNKGGGCGALLLVEQDDVYQTHSSCMGESTYYQTFGCPECGVLTDIDENLPFTPTARRVVNGKWKEYVDNR
jgi:hypothetical protein